jgi:hypothetical protein
MPPAVAEAGSLESASVTGAASTAAKPKAQAVNNQNIFGGFIIGHCIV